MDKKTVESCLRMMNKPFLASKTKGHSSSSNYTQTNTSVAIDKTESVGLQDSISVVTMNEPGQLLIF